jgi:branched-chain amino acid transport system ATP-binding protein
MVGVILLEAENVTKLYGAYCALDGVSFRLAAGEFVSIIGPNGAGKTTLVNVVTGLLRPSLGTVRFKGTDIAGIGAVRLSQLGMARSFQSVNIFPELTVGETIAVSVTSRLGRGHKVVSNLRQDKDVQRVVAEITDLFGLKGKLNERTGRLPQGDKKLIDVASAFALRPELILMDEPTSGVSTAEKNSVIKVMIQAARETGVKSIIQVEHDMDLVFNYSDRIIAIHQGRILADATPQKLRADAAVMAAVTGIQVP